MKIREQLDGGRVAVAVGALGERRQTGPRRAKTRSGRRRSDPQPGTLFPSCPRCSSTRTEFTVQVDQGVVRWFGCTTCGHVWAEASSVAAKPSVRVLLVDDDTNSRSGYTAYLDGLGFAVFAVESGEQALTVAAGWHPDVIVLDLGLPDLDGWEVARRLKASATTAAVPIVALTGATLPHERVSAMRAGCDRHLPKPCVPADLLHAIRQCLTLP